MAGSYSSLLLDLNTWDLVADTSGNIAVASPPYSVAQDIACACRLYQGELWYDTTQGIPYSTQVFGVSPPPIAFIKAQLVAAAMSVPTVATVDVVITGFVNRTLSGQIQFTTSTGVTGTVGFGGLAPWYVSAAALPPKYVT